MFTPRETQIQTDTLHRARDLVVSEILPYLVTSKVKRVVPLGTPIFLPEGRIAHVRSGCLSLEFHGKTIIILEEGDLVGPWIGSLSQVEVAAKGAACEITEYGERDLLIMLSGREDLLLLWNDYLAATSAAFFSLYSEVAGEGDMPNPRMKNFRPGEVILKQGDRDDDVYSLIEGVAEVVVDGVKVGNIGPDEIFGVIAALTGAPRSASVVAVSPGLAMVFNRLEFHSMLRSHPTLVIKMMEDMARVMRELNDRLVSISKGWSV